MRVAVVTNFKAGAANRITPDSIRAALQAAGAQCELCESHGPDLLDATRRAIAHRPDAIVAAGGDGTISSVVSLLIETDIPLGIIPAGTLNHFAKDLRLPLDLDGAVRVITAQQIHAVDVGAVNGRIFINNSSIGIYPQIVQKRDEIRQRLGRNKWIAMLMAFLNVFKRYPTINVRIDSDHLAFKRDTPFVFIGNNRYEFSLNMMGKRPTLDRHVLSVYFTNRTGRFGLFRLALRAVLGHLNQDKDFQSLDVEEFWIDANRPQLRVALDGEVLRLVPPLHYQTRPSALKVLLPPSEPSPAP